MAKNEKSVTDLVCEHIKKQKLLPIPVQTLNEEAEATRYFGGDLKEFLAATSRNSWQQPRLSAQRESSLKHFIWKTTNSTTTVASMTKNTSP